MSKIVVKGIPKKPYIDGRPAIEKTWEVGSEHLPKFGFSEKEIERITDGWNTNSIKTSDGDYTYEASPKYNSDISITGSQDVELPQRSSLQKTKSKVKFVGLHAHSGVGSPFDGFGYPQEHMDHAYSSGCEALALTDHGNMNGFAYQVLHAKKMKRDGKNFKPIFGVEAYFIPCV